MNQDFENVTFQKIRRTKLILSIVFVLVMTFFFIIIVKDLIVPIQEAIAQKDLAPVRDQFQSYGFWGPFFISMTQAFQVVISVMPAQPIQVIAGLSFGPFIGSYAAIAGVFLGNFVIYVLTKKLGKEVVALFKSKKIERAKQLLPSEIESVQKVTFTVLIMYMIPGLPYGIMAITAANSKMKFIRYILLTTLGSIPSLLFCTLFGAAITKDNLWILMIILGILFIISIFFMIYHKSIINWLMKRETKYTMNYFQTHARKPNVFLYTILAIITRIYVFCKFNVSINKKNFKKPKGKYILLFNHPSAYDFAFSYLPLYPSIINSIVAYYYFCNYKTGKLLHRMGAFPKFLYQPDMSTVRNIMKVMKRKNAVLAMAPEGRLSAYGTLETITGSTIKLLKHLGLPIVLAKINGAYLSAPKWAVKSKRGKVEVIYENVLTSDELKSISSSDLHDFLLEKLSYDDFEWQKVNNIVYKGKKFAEGLDHILYICPKCRAEFSYTSSEDILTCSSCHTTVQLTNTYTFHTTESTIPSNIKEWYLLQKQIESNSIKNPEYSYTSTVTLKQPDPLGNGFVEVGKGTTTLTRTGIAYNGTINDETVSIFFKIENIPAILFGVGENFEIYHHNTLYYFIPDNIRECVKWSVVTELMHNQYVTEHNIVGNEG